MKYTREFRLLPSIKTYDYQPWGHKVDCYPVPSFNYIANFLENKGWEIVDYEKIESELFDTHPLPDRVKYGLLIRTIRYDKPKEDETYVYKTNEKGELE